jgi:polyisoprenoid-binding protein YceI
MSHLFLVYLTAATLFMSAGPQAGKYFTRNGNVSFNCGTSLEKIEGINHKAASVLDASTGQLEFTVLIKAFTFDRALMEDHFNENYMESDKFPKAIFKGSIQNNNTIDYTKNGSYKVVVTGDLTIHGVTKPVRTEAELTVKDNNISAKAAFNVILADYNIEIPSLVKDKIDKQAKVVVDILYEPLNK